MKVSSLVFRVLPYVVLILALLGGVVGVPRLMGALEDLSTYLRSEVLGQFSQATGMELRYGSIAPGLLGTLRIRDLTIVRADDSLVFRADQVDIGYNIFDLLSLRGLQGIRSVKITGYVFDLRPLEDFGPGTITEKPKAQVPDMGTMVDTILDGLQAAIHPSFQLYLGRGGGSIHGLPFPLDLTLREANFYQENRDLRMVLSDLSVASEVPVLGAITTTVSIESEWASKAARLFGSVKIDQVRTDLGILVPQGFSYSLNPRELRVERMADSVPFDFLARVDLVSGLVTARAGTAALTLLDLLSPRGALVDLVTPWVRVPLTSNLSVRHQWGTKDLEWSFKGDGRLDVPGVGMSGINLDAGGNISIATIRTLGLQSPALDVALSGRLDIARGILDAKATGEYRLSDPNLVVAFSSPFQLTGKSLAIQDALVSSEGRVLEIPKGSLTFDTLSYGLWIESSDSFGSPMRINALGSLVAGAEHSISLVMEKFHVLDENSLAWLFLLEPELPDFLSPKTTIDLGLGLRFVNLDDFDLSVGLLRITGGEILPGQYFGLSGAGEVNPNQIKLWNLALEAGDVRVHGSLDAQKQGLGWNFSLLPVIQGLELPLEGRILSDASELEFTGAWGSRFKVQNNAGLIRATWNFDELPSDLVLPNSKARARGTGFFDMETSRWSLDVQDFTLIAKGLMPGYPELFSTLEVAGTIQETGVQMSSISYVDPLGSLQGSGSVVGLNPQNLGINLSLQSVQDKVGFEKVEAGIFIQDKVLGGTVSLQNINLQRLAMEDLIGTASIVGNLGGTVVSPSLAFEMRTQDASLGRDALDIRTQGTLSTQELRLNSGSIAILEHQITLNEVVVSFINGSLKTKLSYVSPLVASTGPVLINASLPFSGKVGESGSLEVVNLPLGPAIQQGLAFNGVRSAQGWTWVEESETVRLVHDMEGNFALQASAPFPFNGRAEGGIFGGALDVSITGFSLDLAPFREILDLGFISVEEGRLRGEVRLAGPLVDPSMYGRLVLSSLVANIELSPHQLKAEEVTILLDDKDVIIMPSRITSDEAEASVEGSFVLSPLGLGKFDLKVDVDPSQGIKVKAVYGPMDIDGYATGLVEVRGDGQTIYVDTDLVAYDTSLSLAPSAPSGDSDFDLVLAISVRSGRNVEFLWPNRNIPILRSFLNRDQKVQVDLNLGAGTLGIVGDISLRGGELFYLERSFFIREANLMMNELNGAFNPRLNAQADSRIAIGSNLHKLQLNIKGDRLSELRPSISADPPLPAETLEVIFTGGDPENPGALDLSTVVYTGLDAVSRFGILRGFEDSIRNFLDVDVFSLRSGLFPSLVQGALEPLVSPIDNQTFSFGKYLDNTSILVGKVFGKDVYGEALLQLQATDPTAQGSNDLGLGLGLELGMEWTTPFFDLNWNFAPQDANSLFLRDHTFTFMWNLQTAGESNEE